MPDIKFFDNDKGLKYTKCGGYFDNVKRVIKEMYRQVGDLEINREGNAVKGILLRHLIMPNNIEDSKEILKFIANELSNNTVVDIMGLYKPMYKANEYHEISKELSPSEFEDVVQYAKDMGLTKLILSK
ncbi:MAG: hypothetical protein KID00_09575 [Clostridium argentinense]|uniref:hypothetical protein n=1 Tax=Clostridium butanoliproducens TaxID=2991837 RepID=UPI001DC5C1FB|nr:hypothetical protein [Clostridium butanoliproducens]MBS5824093.1 hypothetical protein [Clostridium argentinense]MDU1350200.1 hypothetical protein [Clostridium argentinense]